MEHITTERDDDRLEIAGKTFDSRLMVGTGKYTDFGVMCEAIAASGAQIVTVAIRRVELGAPGHSGLLDALDLERLQLLPNTAGCRTSEEAVRVARLARAMTGTDWVKLEVIPDAHYLLPDPVETLRAAEKLVAEGFVVLPYINADPVLARRLAQAGCATVMPLASPIGSGRGILTRANLEIIVEEATVPVVVDAGLGVPSEAAACMEMGAAAVLVNTALAESHDPVRMAWAFGRAVEAGRAAYLAGRMPVRAQASPSSPVAGVVQLPDPERSTSAGSMRRPLSPACRTGLLVLRQDLTVLRVNRSFREAFGSDEGAVGQPVTALLPAPGLREAALEVLASGKPQRGLQLEMPWQGGTRSLRVTITGTRLE